MPFGPSSSIIQSYSSHFLMLKVIAQELQPCLATLNLIAGFSLAFDWLISLFSLR